ncbi:hypothetical protein [Paracoccus ravus]|uniref:hypothetical protein n=1 Tax=Paracoccus ravus TaxID=2447760 RepID=UPI00106E1B0A|nr:hypothetical protein [Paracoccus ravus]
MNNVIRRPKGKDLTELAGMLREATGVHAQERIRYALQAGAILSAGRAICESPDCGIKGDNPDARFGRWVSDIMSDTLNTKAAHRYRTLYEAFGHLSIAEVARIGLTNGYSLALAPEETRAEVIEFVQGGGSMTASDARRLVTLQTKTDPAPAPAAKAAQVIEDAVIIESAPEPAEMPQTAPAGELEALRDENARLVDENTRLRNAHGMLWDENSILRDENKRLTTLYTEKNISSWSVNGTVCARNSNA